MPDQAIYERYRQLYVDFQTAIEHHDPEKDSRYHLKEYLKFQENEGLSRGKRGGMNMTYPAVEGGSTRDIGYGHKLKAGESFPGGITNTEAGQLLESDMTEHQERARNVYNRRGQSGDFSKLTPKRQALLTDYSFLGMAETGQRLETQLSSKIREGLSDKDILEEAEDYTGATDRRTIGRKDMYQNIVNHEKGDLAIKKAFSTMEAYLNFSVEEILEANFPGLDSKKQSKQWKSELSKLKNKYESGKFKKQDLTDLDQAINYMLIESFGGLTK